MVAGAVVKAATKVATKAAKSGKHKKKKTQKTSSSKKDTSTTVKVTRDGKTGRFKKQEPVTVQNQKQRQNPVEKHFDRKNDYRMKYGAERERTKQVRAIAGSITSTAGSAAMSDMHESDEATKRAKEKYDAQRENVKNLADAYKNKNTTETINKNYSFKGLDQLQSGGATKTVNPSTGQIEDEQYHNVYSV